MIGMYQQCDNYTYYVGSITAYKITESINLNF